MATIKTAISIQESLFTQVEDVARNLNLSRSQVVSLAIEAFVQRYQNQQIFDALNQAYTDQVEDEEPSSVRARKQHHRRRVEGTW